MKILFINRMMGTSFGGGENFDWQMAKACKQLGHEVAILTAKPLVSQGYVVREVPTVYLRLPYLRYWAYVLEISSFSLLVKISYRIYKIDTFIFNQIAFWWIMLFGKSYDVYQMCGLVQLGGRLCDRQKKKRNAKMMNTLVSIHWPGVPDKVQVKHMPRCHLHIANGDAYRAIKKNRYANVQFIELGVDRKIFAYKKRKPKGIVRLLYVGRLIEIKDLPFLIEAFAIAYRENNAMELHVVGSGTKEYQTLLHRLIAEHSLQNAVLLLGSQCGNALVKCYHESDIFVLTSLYDNFPNVVLEAMSTGLPVIATNVGGLDMMVEEGVNGFLIDKRDKNKFAASILKLAGDVKLRDTLSVLCNKTIVSKKYTWKASAELLLQKYHEVRETIWLP